MRQITISSETVEGKALDQVEEVHKSAAIKVIKPSSQSERQDCGTDRTLLTFRRLRKA